MNVFSDFGSFLVRGNALDLAIGIVLGTSFGIIISSLTNDIIMPPIGLFLGKMDFKNMKIILQEKSATNQEVAIYYGMFIQNVFNFILSGFCLYIIVNFFKKYFNL